MKTKGISFKNRKRVSCPRDEWIINYNTHEALVSKEDFEVVSKRVSVKSRDFELNPDNIFRGLLICADCGAHLGLQSYNTKKHGRRMRYKCDKFSRIGKKGCTIHSINFEDIYEIVLSDIRRHVSLASENKDKYIKMLVKASSENGDKSRAALTKERDRANDRIKELDRILQKLYEDNALGKISDDRYHSMADSMEQEYSALKSRVLEITMNLSETDRAKRNSTDFADLITKYADIQELDFDLVHMLIKKILVHEKEEKDGETVQQIDIYYRLIGNTTL